MQSMFGILLATIQIFGFIFIHTRLSPTALLALRRLDVVFSRLSHYQQYLQRTPVLPVLHMFPLS